MRNATAVSTATESKARVATVSSRGKNSIWMDIGAQVLLIFIALSVLFPILWIIGMSVDPRSLPPNTIFPPGASLDAYQQVLTQPVGPNQVYLWQALTNSLMVAGGTSLIAVVLGTTAGYAFSRFRFPGRNAGMLAFIVVQIMPAVTTLAPLFILLGLIPFGDEPLRRTLVGLAVAYASGALPFVIWNLKGYFDTVPKDLEEAALIDGAGPMQSFIRVVLPLSLPAFAVTILFSFMSGWSEYFLAWTFITDKDRSTMAMLLAGMVGGQYTSETQWNQFAALAIIMSVPIVVLFFLLQRWIVSGLTLGGVKG